MGKFVYLAADTSSCLARFPAASSLESGGTGLCRATPPEAQEDAELQPVGIVPRRSRCILFDAANGRALSAKNRTQLFTQDETGADDRDGKKCHRPYSESTCHKTALAKELVKLVDGFRDREVLLLLSKDE